MTSPQTENPKGWYLVVAHFGRERLAAYHLKRQGYEVYLPMRAPLTSARSKTGALPEPRPFFPRYLFVQVDLTQPGWRSIYSTIGVHSVLTSGVGENARPRPVGEGLVKALKAREVDGLIVLPPKSDCPHEKGDMVRVRIGRRFGGIEAVFEERVDAKRAIILISLLGRDSRQEVPLASLE